MAGPRLDLGGSRRAQEIDAVRKVIVRMSRRRVLWEGGALERPGAALGSATELLKDAEEARTELPPKSPFDPVLEGLQDACNVFRRNLEATGTSFPFGDALYNLRAAALAFAQRVAAEFKMSEADRLAEKIDLDTAGSALGREGGAVYVLPASESPSFPDLRAPGDEKKESPDQDEKPDDEER